MSEERFTKIERELQTMLGMQVGTTAVLMAMITTHPRYEDFQLAATSALELVCQPGKGLSERSREAARKFVEELQLLQAVQPGAPQRLIQEVLRGASKG